MAKGVRYKLVNTDAFRWLFDRQPASVHAVVTDPPYSVREYGPLELEKKRRGKGGVWRLPQAYDGCKRSPMPRFTVLRPQDHRKITQFHCTLAPLLHNALVPGGHVIIASQNLLLHLVVSAFTDAGFEMRGQIARVVKTLRGGDRPKGAHEEYPGVCVTPRCSWEPWLVFRKHCEGLVKHNLRKWGTGALRRRPDGRPFRDLIESSPARGEERAIAPHPSLKPQAFVRQVVWAALPLGRGTILDPFAGAGSVVAAAEYHKLKSIGLEIDKEFYKLAKKAVPRLAAFEVRNDA